MLSKIKLAELISEGKVKHIYGLIGCCNNYYVTFPNETQKYMYNVNKQFQENYQINFQTIYIQMQTCHQDPTRPTSPGND